MNVEIITEGQPYQGQFMNWWQHYMGFPISPKLLSNYQVAVLDPCDEPIAISHLYPTKGSQVLFVGYTARDPKIEKMIARLALETLERGLRAAAKILDYKVLYMISDKPSLNEILREQGYFEGSQCIEFLKEV